MKIHFSLPQSTFLQLAQDINTSLILPFRREVRNKTGTITDIQNCGEIICTLSITGTRSAIDMATDMTTKRRKEASLRALSETGLSHAKFVPDALPSAADISTVLKISNEERQARCALEVKVSLLPEINPVILKELDYSQPVISKLLEYEATNIYVDLNSAPSKN